MAPAYVTLVLLRNADEAAAKRNGLDDVVGEYMGLRRAVA